jgi:hypothetical protein
VKSACVGVLSIIELKNARWNIETNVKIWSGVSVDRFAENFFKLVDGAMNKGFETFVRFKNTEKVI